MWDVGRAAVNAAGYGISEAGRAFQAGKQKYQKRAEEARNAAPSGENAGGMADWARNFFAKKPEPTAIENIRTSAKKRHSAGVAMLATGITFAVIFGITAIACFGTAGAFTTLKTRIEDYKPAQTSAEGGVVISSADGIVQVEGMYRLCSRLDQLHHNMDINYLFSYPLFALLYLYY